LRFFVADAGNTLNRNSSGEVMTWGRSGSALGRKVFLVSHRSTFSSVSLCTNTGPSFFWIHVSPS
jgi:hypothetical protein